MFEYELLDRARADRAHIVLPEGTEDRVLSAADTLLRRAAVEVTLLGDPAVVCARATQLQLDITAAAVIDRTPTSCASGSRRNTPPGAPTRA